MKISGTKEIICLEFIFIAARSSNGRTTVSGTVYRGSSPCRAAMYGNDKLSLLFYLLTLYQLLGLKQSGGLFQKVASNVMTSGNNMATTCTEFVEFESLIGSQVVQARDA